MGLNPDGIEERRLIIALALWGIADITSTMAGLGVAGFTELNPFMSWVVNLDPLVALAVMAGGKTFAVAMLLTMLRRSRRAESRLHGMESFLWGAGRVTVLLWAVAAFWNLLMLIRAQGAA